MEPADACTSGSVAEVRAPRSALRATLNVASSAANLVLFPYVVAGRAAYQATSFAVTAPMKVTKHVAHSITESWQQQQTPQQQHPENASKNIDLFGERAASASATTPTSPTLTTPDDACTRNSGPDLFGEGEAICGEKDAPLVEGVLFESEAPAVTSEPVETTDVATDSTPPVSPTHGVVSQLIFLPVRFVSSSVSSAAALPASAISLGGRTLSGAVSSSQSLASTALVASGGLVLRTSRHVASGISYGAFSTAHRVTGLLGSSVRTASYVIPPSVSSVLWQGMEKTGSVSTNVISYAIAVPTYRMAQALLPQIGEFLTEQQLVDSTKDGVKLLVKVLGPQNAFYVLKFMYETVNSEEVYDAFLLCQDLVRESLDAENYKKAGSSVRKATGVETLAPVVKSIYDMMPSLDELVDAVVFVGEVVDEVLQQAAVAPASDDSIMDTGRFEYLLSDEETDGESDLTIESEGDQRSTSTVDSKNVSFAPVEFAQDAFVGEVSCNDDDIVGGEEADFEVVQTGPIELTEDVFVGVSAEEEKDDGVEEKAEDGGNVGGVVGVVGGDAFGSGFGGVSSSHEDEADDSLADLFNSSVSFFSSVLDSNEASMLLNTFGDFIDVLVD